MIADELLGRRWVLRGTFFFFFGGKVCGIMIGLLEVDYAFQLVFCNKLEVVMRVIISLLIESVVNE